jgi:hypothetical protein
MNYNWEEEEGRGNDSFQDNTRHTLVVTEKAGNIRLFARNSTRQLMNRSRKGYVLTQLVQELL